MKNIFALDSAISYQESNWKKRKKTINIGKKNALPFITISREYGCLGYAVSESIMRIFNEEYWQTPRWTVYDRKLLDRIMEDLKISYELADTLTDKARSSMVNFFRTTFTTYPPEAIIYKKLVETVRILAANGHAIIVGRVGNMITKDMPKGYHVRIIASLDKRTENISKKFGISLKEAKKVIEKKGNERENFVLNHLKVDPAAPSNYDIVINATDLSFDETARFIITGMKVAEIIDIKR